ncbi:MAG: diguanylate cyclase [Nocardioidaceae bacterium]|nr:diguanylate cyclase [Nocardioidaceae bacterium]
MYAAHAGIAIYRAQLMDQLIENEQAFRLEFENAGIGMAVLSLKANESSRYLRANTAFCHLVGYTEKELKTMSTADLTHPDDRDTDLVNIEKAVTTDQRVFEVEKRYQHADGGSVWVCVTTSVIEDANGHPVSAISQVQDIGQRRALLKTLARDALHDSLTGLANRRALYQHLHQIQASGEGGAQTCVLFCDLDGFKSVNDRFGHYFGDRALTAVAHRLGGAVGDEGVVARLGGDEFVVVAPLAKIEAFARRLTETVAEPFIVNGTSVALTVSIGIAALGALTEPAQAIHRADWAMYEVKRLGGNGYIIAPDSKDSEQP